MVSDGSMRHIATFPEQNLHRAFKIIVGLKPAAPKHHLEKHHLIPQETYVSDDTKLVLGALEVLPQTLTKGENLTSRI